MNIIRTAFPNKVSKIIAVLLVALVVLILYSLLVGISSTDPANTPEPVIVNYTAVVGFVPTQVIIEGGDVLSVKNRSEADLTLESGGDTPRWLPGKITIKPGQERVISNHVRANKYTLSVTSEGDSNRNTELSVTVKEK